MNKVEAVERERIEELRQAAYMLFDEKTALLVHLGFRLGLRIGDLLKLTYGHFLTDSRHIWVREERTGKRRRIPYCSDTRDRVISLMHHQNGSRRGYIFTGRDGVKPMHRSTAFRKIRYAGEVLDMEVSPQSLRKTYVHELYRVSGDAKAVQKAMRLRHKSYVLEHYF